MTRDDIVTQLRAGGRSRPEPLLCDIAADEIERLRVAGDALAVALFALFESYCGDESDADLVDAWLEARRG